MTTVITSSANERLKRVKKLMARREYRREAGLFAAEGRRLVDDALLAGLRPQTLLLAEGLAPGARRRYEAACADVCLLPDGLFASLCETKTPQGVVGVFRLPQAGAGLSGGRLVLLASLQDPGNVGTILRTALALGIDRALLTADCPDPFSPKVLRASMGASFRLPITSVPDAADAVRQLRQDGVAVLAATLCEGARAAGRGALPARCCVVIGNEGAGLPPALIAACDGAVVIPMRGGAQSLNAATAAAILLWEMARGQEM